MAQTQPVQDDRGIGIGIGIGVGRGRPIEPLRVINGFGSGARPDLVIWAREYAASRLARQPQRWAHTVGVAIRTVDIAAAVRGSDLDLLIAAAWLHDIGYDDRLTITRFHPLDGGLHLLGIGADVELAALVAHHSGARFVAAPLGFRSDLEMAFPFRVDAVSDIVTAADQTVDPQGRPTTVEARMSEMLQRHGPRSVQALVHKERSAYMRAAVSRVESRLTATPEVSLVDRRQRARDLRHPHTSIRNSGGGGVAVGRAEVAD